ncbi:MAG: hypothetical protein AAGM84_15945 [Pseudomonadota bacterium]
MLRFFTASLRSACLGAAMAGLIGTTATAQSTTQGQGAALSVDLLEEARTLSMRNFYARSLYSYIRNNPAVMNNPHFYVSFLIYLMSQADDFDCGRIFSSEFERNDYFTQAFQLAPQLTEIVQNTRITERFDIPFIVDTGRYNFNNGRLELTNRRAVGAGSGALRRAATAGSARGNRTDPQTCARNSLKGTAVRSDEFPWGFAVAHVGGNARGEPAFPFEALQLSQADARTLFERFGRQLYAIISYQVQVATDGRAQVQITATDGQLFGLSNDAVVRVRTFAHPTLSQANYLDVTNPLRIDLGARGSMQVALEQQGFRAVGKGVYTGSANNFAAGAQYPIVGSGAVGNSAFILRIATPYLSDPEQRNRAPVGQERYVTFFGNIDFEGITAVEAPVSGTAIVLGEFDAQADKFKDGPKFGFRGAFRDKNAPAPTPAAPVTPGSSLDVLSNQPAAPAPSE